jgi:hypothetical protein
LPSGWVWTTIGEVVDKMSNGITKRQNKDWFYWILWTVVKPAHDEEMSKL